MNATKSLWALVCVALLFALLLDNAWAMFTVSVIGLAIALAIVINRRASR